MLPKFAGQPATTEDARTLQFQPAQAHLHAIDGIGGNFPIVGKQTHRGEALLGLVEYIQRLAPRRLLSIVDLAEIENGALRCLAAGQSAVLDHAEVPMVLAVLAPVCAAQKHPQQQHARDGHLRKEARSSPRLFSPIFAVPALKAKGIFWRADRKCPPGAKVGLAAHTAGRRWWDSRMRKIRKSSSMRGAQETCDSATSPVPTLKACLVSRLPVRNNLAPAPARLPEPWPSRRKVISDRQSTNQAGF